MSAWVGKITFTCGNQDNYEKKMALEVHMESRQNLKMWKGGM